MGERIVRTSTWEGYIKNADGEIEYTRPLNSVTTEPTVDEGDFIRQAKPTVVRPTRRKKPVRSDNVTLVGSDAQIPFHDETSMGLFLTAIDETKPDNVLLLGDMLDFPSFSRFEQRQEWAGMVQEAFDRYHLFLAEIRARHAGRIAVVHGNHEERLPKMLRRDAADLIGLKRANTESALGVLTIPFLARYDDLEIEAVTGYPNGTFWLEENLQAIHGTETKRRGASAQRYLGEQAVSTLFGHDHRLQVAWQTQAVKDGKKDRVAASPGALCRTDGYVPSYHYTTAESGLVVPRSEDWQNGALLVLHNEHNHDVMPLRMNDGKINIGGNYYA